MIAVPENSLRQITEKYRTYARINNIKDIRGASFRRIFDCLVDHFLVSSQKFIQIVIIIVGFWTFSLTLALATAGIFVVIFAATTNRVAGTVCTIDGRYN
jgi:hypothetical protein